MKEHLQIFMTVQNCMLFFMEKKKQYSGTRDIPVKRIKRNIELVELSTGLWMTAETEAVRSPKDKRRKTGDDHQSEQKWNIHSVSLKISGDTGK